MHKISFTVLVGLLVLSLQLFSQTYTSSPYSRFGIGDLSGITYSPGISMGSTAIALRSNHSVNPVNPASYSAFDSLSFVFDMGGTDRSTVFSTSQSTLKKNRTEMTFFSCGFPVTHWWSAAFGLIPFTNTGYAIKDTMTIDTLNLENTYRGSGGISQVYVGNSFSLKTWKDTSYKIIDNHKHSYINKHQFNVGFNTTYYFGSLDRKTSSIFPNETQLFNMYTTNRTIISDFGFRYGMQYIYNRIEMKGSEKRNKYSIVAGLTFDNQNSLNAKNTELVTKYINMGGTVTIDTLVDSIVKKSTVILPRNIGFGLAFIQNERFTIAFDYRWQQWSAARFLGENISLKNSQTFALGFQFLPDPYRMNKYFNMVNYRFGAHFTQSFLMLNNHNINDMGISFGLGLPIRRPEKSEFTGIRRKLPPVVNVAVEIGQRGTTSDNLIREKYIQVSLNLSIYDIWFVKRKFN